MLKHSILMALAAGMVFGTALAQSAGDGTNRSLDNQFVIYKWYERGIAHYGKAPPRGVTNYIMLNEYGMKIRKDRPYSTGRDSNVIRPMMPASNEDYAAGNSSGDGAQVPGTITREQRCDTARKNAEMLRTKKTVYEDDGSGNLVPLSAEQMQSRLLDVEREVSATCD